MTNQTILFTIMPRGISLNPATLPVSVYVSPRLTGSTVLGDYPDWLNWTALRRKRPLELTILCDGKTINLESDPEPLRPHLWKAMFNKETYVRPFQFPDYTNRTIYSYPMRMALSTIKNMYQQAGVELALPEEEIPIRKEEDYTRRRAFLRGLLNGLAVNWSDQNAAELRKKYQASFYRLKDQAVQVSYNLSDLNPDGTLKNLPSAGSSTAKYLNQGLAEPFAVFHHMPPGQPIEKNPPDFKTLIDFHQALSSLNSYPELLRALGLVFDFELPIDFVSSTTPGGYKTLAVVNLPHAEWRIPTETVPKIAPLETAYLYFDLSQTKVFTTAPGILGGVNNNWETFGLLNLEPNRYGLAQVDVDGGLMKSILLAESWQEGARHVDPADHSEVFDPTTTLPSLRSGGFSLFADARAFKLLKTLQDNKTYNTALNANSPQKNPFFAEDLLHGYRLDIWDSHSDQWRSLHRRNGKYQIGDQEFSTTDEEGFSQLAATQAAPDPNNPPPNDLYLHEAIARWAGWSSSVPFPARALSRDPDPDKALKDDPQHPINEPATPFKMTTDFQVVMGSLPGLRFGRRYRLRIRPVDLCGNSLKHDDPLADWLAQIGLALPRDPFGLPYLRFEPVAAPLVVPRQVEALTSPGSSLERMVIRTYNSDPGLDSSPADLTGSDRHILPPTTSVEMGERLGMFDDQNGKLSSDIAMYKLIAERDKGELQRIKVNTAGQDREFPLEGDEKIELLPYLPDVLSRGAALRALPGSEEASLGTIAPGASVPGSIPYVPLDDPNPHPDSATLVSFDGDGDWQKIKPFRLALADGSGSPYWDPQERVLRISLPKGVQHVIPLSSYMSAEDLKLMGVWAWLREYINEITVKQPDAPALQPGFPIERLAHILQRAVEGGHWMLTPPRLLSLVHALQQPLGQPEFIPLAAQRKPYGTENKWGEVDERDRPDTAVLQTQPEDEPTSETELAALTAWREPGSLEAYLLGALQVHAASTEKVELLAEWIDSVDDAETPRQADQDAAGNYRLSNSAQADLIPLSTLKEGYLYTEEGDGSYRYLAYYDSDHDLLGFVRQGDQLGNLPSGVKIYRDAAPRHHFNDTLHHRVRYTAVSTSRYREYFPQDQDLDFTRRSTAITVEVPASARPASPQVSYVIPTFGWQRQSQTNLKRSVRFGGGLRIYLERPWFSSGDDERLAVALYDYRNGYTIDREKWKPYVTQWGGDPIWLSDDLDQLPAPQNFPDAINAEEGLSLPGQAPGRVRVAAYPVEFDYELQKWFVDLTIDTNQLAYTPFVRLALVRYQPYALPDSKLSAAVLADYIQLTPERSAVITADPYHAGSLRLTVSGVAPAGPAPVISGIQPTSPVTSPARVIVSLQQRIPNMNSDLAWEDAPAGTAAIFQTPQPGMPALVRWTGMIQFAKPPEPGQYRILVRELEYLSANYIINEGDQKIQPSRLIYAETIDIDSVLVEGPAENRGTTLTE